ncbi:nucleotidyltransferase family protein [Paenibacillus sp. MMS20-IR301]|uniref:nucleotidyltransferase family protein n=1 Tax=Paenibacillus sp. MMS20-IR301 TaxID=2895946 RepID=UPI0028F07F8F|nr:nucleotidyltransferase family protein [Paenibacillus sp. MMS20-IR301]WNS41866.1 nucleotidyltransferase family protein [Paenibacillus sp. MMS20-IR301]
MQQIHKRIHNGADILRLVEEDAWMMGILETARTLQLPDWWVCAGFVRSKIWDVQHGFPERTPLADIDVIYYDPGDLREETEKCHEAELQKLHPGLPWSLKNQARMHTVNNLPPYSSAADGMSKFPETATALGLSLTAAGQLILAAPHGAADAIDLVLRPAPYFAARPQLLPVYEKRIRSKNWQRIWSGLRILPAEPPKYT